MWIKSSNAQSKANSDLYSAQFHTYKSFSQRLSPRCDRCNEADAQIHGGFGILCEPMAAPAELRLAGLGLIVGHLCQSGGQWEELGVGEVCLKNTSLQLHTVSKSGSNDMSTALYCLDKLYSARAGN